MRTTILSDSSEEKNLVLHELPQNAFLGLNATETRRLLELVDGLAFITWVLTDHPSSVTVSSPV
jgi:hypothetical protein